MLGAASVDGFAGVMRFRSPINWFQWCKSFPIQALRYLTTALSAHHCALQCPSDPAFSPDADADKRNLFRPALLAHAPRFPLPYGAHRNWPLKLQRGQFFLWNVRPFAPETFAMRAVTTFPSQCELERNCLLGPWLFGQFERSGTISGCERFTIVPDRFSLRSGPAGFTTVHL